MKRWFTAAVSAAIMAALSASYPRSGLCILNQEFPKGLTASRISPPRRRERSMAGRICQASGFDLTIPSRMACHPVGLRW